MKGKQVYSALIIGYLEACRLLYTDMSSWKDKGVILAIIL